MIGCFDGNQCLCPDGVAPTPVVEGGVPVYLAQNGGRGRIVLEAQRGANGRAVGTSLLPGDPTLRPSLQIEADKAMGNGSADVCDVGAAPIGGGVPGITPAGFPPDQFVTDALQDFACRFGTPSVATKSRSADLQLGCTLNQSGAVSFLSPVAATVVLTQFCDDVAEVADFNTGDTLLTVRVLDSAGTPGPTAQMKIRVPTPTPSP